MSVVNFAVASVLKTFVPAEHLSSLSISLINHETVGLTNTGLRQQIYLFIYQQIYGRGALFVGRVVRCIQWGLPQAKHTFF
jgi:hypothetical protein